jgi:serine/threonine protein kinase
MTNQGGLSVVYTGSIDGKDVVVKVGSHEDISREVRMYKALNATDESLKHTPFVKLYSAYTDPGLPGEQGYMTMQKAKSTLRDAIPLVRQWSEGARIRFALQVASCILNSLKYMHESGYVHYDLKPDNIAIDFQLQENAFDTGNDVCPATFLLDLGLTQDIRNPEVGFAVGSPLYYSYAHTLSQVAFSADIESLGHILAELLVGYPLYWYILREADGNEITNPVSMMFQVSKFRISSDFDTRIREELMKKLNSHEYLVDLLVQMISYEPVVKCSPPRKYCIPPESADTVPEIEELQRNIASVLAQLRGGRTGFVVYRGHRYKLRTGSRGGKYILVGPNKQKVYM